MRPVRQDLNVIHLGHVANWMGDRHPAPKGGGGDSYPFLKIFLFGIYFWNFVLFKYKNEKKSDSELPSVGRGAAPTFFRDPRWPATHEHSRARPLTRPPLWPVLIAGPGLRRTTAIGPRRRSTCRLFFLRRKMLPADRSRERATSAAHQSACSVFLYGPRPASPTSLHALSSTAFLFFSHLP